MNRFGLGAAAVIVLHAVAARPGTAQTTLTFDANACAGSGAITGGPTYIESGFQLSFTGAVPSLAYAAWCSSNENYPGNSAILENFGGAMVTLSRVGGGTFSLSSIDLAALYFRGWEGSVLFTGYLAGGGTVSVSQSWTRPTANPVFQTDAFDGTWTNLVDVQFAQGNFPFIFQFDNIVVDGNVVPEPATLTLLATGLAGLAAARRRRKA